MAGEQHGKTKKLSTVMQIFSKVSKSKTDELLLETGKSQEIKTIQKNLAEIEKTTLIKDFSVLDHSEKTSKPKINRSSTNIQKNLEKVKQEHGEWMKNHRNISKNISESVLDQNNLILENQPAKQFDSKEFLKTNESQKLKTKYSNVSSVEAVNEERVKQVKEIRKILPNVCEICSYLLPEPVKDKDNKTQPISLCNCDKGRSKSIWTQRSLDVMNRELMDEKTRSEVCSTSLLLGAVGKQSGSISEGAKHKQKKNKQRKQKATPKETSRPEFKISQFVIKSLNKSTT